MYNFHKKRWDHCSHLFYSLTYSQLYPHIIHKQIEGKFINALRQLLHHARNISVEWISLLFFMSTLILLSSVNQHGLLQNYQAMHVLHLLTLCSSIGFLIRPRRGIL